MDILIRKAENKDISKILDLLSQVLEVHVKARPDLFISGTTKYTFEELSEIIKNNTMTIFVATLDDIVCGYCFCEEKEINSINMKRHKTIYIDDLCVDENIRGKSIGRKLYEYVINYARANNFYNVTLNVWEGNDSAKAFYEKLGMKVKKTEMEQIL